MEKTKRINSAQGIKTINGYKADINKLISQAESKEEIKYLKNLIVYKDFPFQMQYIQKMKCGHYEIFQTPHVPIDLSESNCTDCICNI